MFIWEERSLAELVTEVQTKMPPTNPNSLSRESYLAIVAYVMQVNGFPPGEAELGAAPDKLEQISITPKP
jgi:hypothetical protein